MKAVEAYFDNTTKCEPAVMAAVQLCFQNIYANPPHILGSAQLGHHRAHSSFRFSFFRLTTDAEIRCAIARIPNVVSSSQDTFSLGWTMEKQT